ncbi:MAG: hypothetical protein Q9M36_05685 [Sulfurovum sp.]|nr:hypothetical protein [Sulfurovum sp.]
MGDSGNIIDKPNIDEIQEFISKYYSKEKFTYFAVVAFNKQTDGIKELQILKNNNIDEAIFISSFDGKEKVKRVSTVKSLNSKFKHTILVSFDNIKDIKKYENVALDSFLAESKNLFINFGFEYPDLKTGKIYQKKSTQLLSFNATNKFSGKCEQCNGHGLVEDIDLDLLIFKDKNLDEHFLNLEDNGKGAYKYVNIRPNSIQKICKNRKLI